MDEKTIVQRIREILSAKEPEGDVPPEGDATEPPAANAGSEDDNDPGEDGGAPDHHQEESDMDRSKLILALVAAAALDFSREEYEGMSDERLTTLAKATGVDCGCTGNEPAANEGGGDGNDPPTDTPDFTAVLDRMSKVEETLGAIAEKLVPLEAVAANAKAEHDTAHAAAVGRLTANEACAIPEDVLKGMTLAALQGVEKSLAPVDYRGLAGPRVPMTSNAAEEAGFMPIPDMFAAEAN